MSVTPEELLRALQAYRPETIMPAPVSTDEFHHFHLQGQPLAVHASWFAMASSVADLIRAIQRSPRYRMSGLAPRPQGRSTVSLRTGKEAHIRMLRGRYQLTEAEARDAYRTGAR